MKQQLHSVMRWWRQCRAQAGSVLVWRRWSSALALGFLLLAPLVSQTASADVLVKTAIVYTGGDPGVRIYVGAVNTNGNSTYYTSTVMDTDGNGSTLGNPSTFPDTHTSTVYIKFGNVQLDSGDINNYQLSNYICVGNGHTQPIGRNVLTALSPNFNGSTITCTVTANYQYVKLILNKTYINPYYNETASFSASTGFLTNRKIASNTVAVSAVTDGVNSPFTSYSPELIVRVGEIGTLPADIFNVTTDMNNYNITAYVCNTSDGTSVITAATGTGTTSVTTLTIPNNLTQGIYINCTVTLTNKTAQLVIKKIWSDGNSTDTATMGSTTNFTANTTSFIFAPDGTTNVAPNTKTSAVYLLSPGGVQGNLPLESFASNGSGGYASNYTQSPFVCVYGKYGTTQTVLGTFAQGAPFTMPSNIPGQTVTCTLTDTIIKTNFYMEKIWSNGTTTDSSTIPISGFNTAALNSAPNGGLNEAHYNTPAYVSVKAGSTGLLPIETFSPVASQSNYLTGQYACAYYTSYTNDSSIVPASSSSVTQGATLTLPPIAGPSGYDFKCVLTNTFKTVTLVLTDIMVNPKSGDSFKLPATTSTAALTVNSSTPASTPGVIMRAGTSVNLPIQTPGTNTLQNNYTTTNYVCMDNLSATTTPYAQGAVFTVPNTYSVNSVVITCTLTNTYAPVSVTIKEVGTVGVGTFNFALTGLSDTVTGVNTPNVNLTTVTAGVPVTSASIGTAGTAVTILQTPVPGFTNAAQCVDSSPVNSPTLSFPDGNVTLPASSVLANTVWVCTFTNNYTLPRVAVSVVTNGGTTLVGFVFTGLSSTDVNLQTTTDGGTALKNPSLVYGTIGTAASIQFTGGSLSTYLLDSLTCTDSGPSGASFTWSNTNYTMTLTSTQMAENANWTCAYVVFLQPQLVLKANVQSRVKSSDQFVLAISAGSSTVTSIDTSGGGTTTPIPSPNNNKLIPYTFSVSAAGTTTLAAYSANFSCLNAYTGANATTAYSVSQSGYTFTFTPKGGDNLTCTFALTPAAPTLKLSKALTGVRVVASDQFTLAIKNGATPVISVDTGGTLSAVTTGGSASPLGGLTGVTLVAGTSYTLSEVGATAFSTVISNYTSKYTCTNLTTSSSTLLPTAATGLSFPLSLAAGDIVSCVFTNKAATAQLVIQKTWVNGLSTDKVTIPGTSVFLTPQMSNIPGTAAGTTPTAAVPVAINTSDNLPTEVFSFGTAADYNASGYVCTDGTLTNTVAPNGILLIPIASANKTITCTLTNSRILASVTIAANSIGGTGSFPYTLNGLNNTTDNVTTSVSGTSVSSSQTNTAIGAATITQMANANYSTTASCTDSNGAITGNNTTLTFPSNIITLPVGNMKSRAAYTCTFTNIIKPLLTTTATISSLVNATDIFALTSSPTGPAATNGTSSMNSGPFTATVGTAYVLSITTTSGALTAYNSSYICSNAYTGPGATVMTATATVGNSVTVTPAAGDAITCAFTVTPKPATLTLTASFSGNRVLAGNQLTVQILNSSSLLQNATTSSTTTGSGSVVDSGTGSTGATLLPSGTQYTLKLIAAGTPSTTLSNYSTTYSCTNVTAGTGTVMPPMTAGLSFTLTPQATDNITCAFVSTPNAPTLTLVKALGSARGNSGDQFVVRILSGAAVVSTSVATTGTGSVVASGGNITTLSLTANTAYTLSEISAGTTVLSNYTGSINCSNALVGGTAGFSGSGQSFGLTMQGGDNFTCTLTNTFNGLPKVRVLKTTVNGSGSNTFNFSLTGLSASSDSITLTGAASASGLTTITGTIGVAATLTELQTSGWPANPVSANCVDLNSATPSATFGTLVANQLSVSAAQMVLGADIRCTFTNNFSLTVSGQVFIDNGAGAGTPNDGVMNGAEAGQSGVLVQLTNCSGSVLSSTNTNASGNYSLAVPNATVTGASLCVLETNSGVRISTGASVGATALPSGTATAALGGSYTYTRGTDKIALLWNGSGHTGLNFGDVDASTFSASGVKAGLPNVATFYPHIFIAGTAGSVSFSISSEVSVPASGWSTIVFADPTCSGTLLPGATQLYPATVATVVTAGQTMCVLLQERTPGSAVIGNSNDLKLVATMILSNAAPSLSLSYSVEDITNVTASALTLVKEVRNVTQSGSFGLINQAKSGETLEYRITYANNGTAAISNLVISDVTPLYTTFVSSNLVGAMSGALTACVKNTPVNPLPALGLDCTTTQVVGGTGTVGWIFTGLLNPGVTGAVLFDVKVN